MVSDRAYRRQVRRGCHPTRANGANMTHWERYSSRYDRKGKVGRRQILDCSTLRWTVASSFVCVILEVSPEVSHCFDNLLIASHNKAIRDGKYLAHHMPVLGNVHPIKIENFDIFSWRHFSARSSCYIINWYGYPRGSHEKYLKEIVSPVFFRYAIELLHVKHRTCHKWR